MLELTELASQKLKDYLDQNNMDSPVRVTLMQSCGGAALGLALDELKDSDTSLEQSGVQLVIDNDLKDQCGDVKVDFVEPTDSGCGCGGGGGFSVTSTNPIGSGGCGGSCSSGGCSC